jgi:hypothetical protein
MNILVTFGRFNIPHTGHLSLLHRSPFYDKIIVGLSSSPQCAPVAGRIEALKALMLSNSISSHNITFVPSKTVFSLIRDVFKQYPRDRITVTLGSDRQKLLQQVTKYYPVKAFPTERPTGAPSSSECRQYFRTNGGSQGLYRLWSGNLYARDIAYELYKQEKINAEVV